MRVRNATVQEVLALDPRLPQATQDIVRQLGSFGLWRFDRDQIGAVTGQLPGEMGPPHGGRIGSLSELLAFWHEWLASSDEVATRDRKTHEHWLGELRRGRPMLSPILYFAAGSSRHVLDGRHRLFAALDYAAEYPGYMVDIYWCDAASQM